MGSFINKGRAILAGTALAFGANAWSKDDVMNTGHSNIYYDHKSKQYFVNNKVSFNIKSLDDGLFVDRIEVSIDDGEFSPYDKSISFSSEGQHLLRFKAVDPINNWSPTQSFRIYVDLTPPQTQLNLVGQHYSDGSQNFVSPSTQIQLSSYDNLSGVSKVLWRDVVKEGQTSIYKGRLRFRKSGNHTINYASVDNVGNMDQWSSFNFVVDEQAPQSQITLLGKSFQKGKTLFANLGTKFKISSSDNAAGVKQIEYRVNKGTAKKYKGEFSVDSNNRTLIQFRAADHVGNQERWQDYSINLDTTAPKLSIKKSGRYRAMAGKIFALPGFKISANAYDAQSGIKHILVDNSPLAQTKHSVTFDKDGDSKVSLLAIDNVGNSSNLENVEVFIDQTPPVSQLSSTYPMRKIGDFNLATIPNKLDIASKDSGVGLQYIEYSYDGKNFKRFSKAIDLATWNTRKRTVFYRGVDFLGNREKTQSMKIYVKNNGPNIALFVEDEEFGDIPLSKLKKKLSNKKRMPASK